MGEIQAKMCRVLDSTVPVFKPVIAALGCCGYGAVENDRVAKRALLDSGATHALYGILRTKVNGTMQGVWVSNLQEMLLR